MSYHSALLPLLLDAAICAGLFCLLVLVTWLLVKLEQKRLTSISSEIAVDRSLSDLMSSDVD